MFYIRNNIFNSIPLEMMTITFDSIGIGTDNLLLISVFIKKFQ